MPSSHNLPDFVGLNLPIGLGPSLDPAALALWRAGVAWNSRAFPINEVVTTNPEREEKPQPLPNPPK